MGRKILLVANRAESFFPRMELMRQLAELGYVVYLVAPGMTEEISKKFKQFGYHCYDLSLSRVGLNPFEDVLTFVKLRKLIREIKPRGVICYTIKPNIYGIIAAYLEKVPLRIAMVTGLGFIFSPELGWSKKWLAGLAKKFYRFAFKRATKVFFLNEDDRSLFCELTITEFDKAVVINGEGIDLEKFKKRPIPKVSMGIHFLLIARLLVDKGIREYVDAARSVKRKYPNTVFHLVGGMDENPASITQKELDGWIKEEVILYHGALKDVTQVIAQSHVGVLPSYREGVPLVLLESMATGRPVITTDVPGCRDVVVNQMNGMIVPVKDFESLAQAMLSFIRKPVLIEVMGDKASEHVANHYDVIKVSKDILMKGNVC
jgi:glycosyltransferase involved in cell wall biosynthesis